jgi:hypothetical protein
MNFSAKKKGDKWEIWEHVESEHTEGFKRQVCVMTSDDILQLFNETVPRTVEEPYMEGNVDCTHAWRPWKFNSDFIQCAHCPAMRRVRRLVPKVYE